jgi:hypothetical protein
LAGIIRNRPGPAGPIAVVVADNHDLHSQAESFVAKAGAARLVRVFRQQHQAQAWLDELGGPVH